MAEGGDHDRTATLSRRVQALEGLLSERGLVGEGELDDLIERLLARTGTTQGARVVARAWVDPGFKARLLDDANEAIAELGLDMGAGPSVQKLVVVENTEQVHNVIVCTLCSCYPIGLLGPPPTWYKDLAYRSRVVRDPRGVLSEFGLGLPDDVGIRVWDASSELRYLVLPRRPEGTAGLSETELAGRISRDALIGTAIVG
ncbi:MAG: nitrile hydratase subunit alpha [Nitriliruptorales bacterium]|nr:nitrile hydratase subunit alpha [Nitriliruptorales bacterium]